MTKPTPELSEEEKELFRNHMQGVAPLPSANKHQPPKTPPPVRKMPKQPENSTITPPSAPKLAIPLSSAYPETVGTDTVLSYVSCDLSKKRFREFKNGLIRCEAKLDLHGLRSEAAEEALLAFLTQQISLNHRFLLIIHGKGGLNINTPPLLKSLVNHWLRQIPQVLAFHSAMPKDGGTGAVYVFLKRGTNFIP